MRIKKNKFFKKINLEEFNRSIQWRRQIASGQKKIAESALTNDLQKVIDENGLSDTMLVLVKK